MSGINRNDVLKRCLKIVEEYFKHFSDFVHKDKYDELKEFLIKKGILERNDPYICADPFYDGDALYFGYKVLKMLYKELKETLGES